MEGIIVGPGRHQVGKLFHPTALTKMGESAMYKVRALADAEAANGGIPSRAGTSLRPHAQGVCGDQSHAAGAPELLWIWGRREQGRINAEQGQLIPLLTGEAAGVAITAREDVVGRKME